MSGKSSDVFDGDVRGAAEGINGGDGASGGSGGSAGEDDELLSAESDIVVAPARSVGRTTVTILAPRALNGKTER